MTHADKRNEPELILVLGLMRSIDILEQFILEHVESDATDNIRTNYFLNRVKARRNTKTNPIEAYLAPCDDV